MKDIKEKQNTELEFYIGEGKRIWPYRVLSYGTTGGIRISFIWFIFDLKIEDIDTIMEIDEKKRKEEEIQKKECDEIDWKKNCL